MNSRQIHCENCRASMGEIRDARLRKDIRYLCAECLKPLTYDPVGALSRMMGVRK